MSNINLNKYADRTAYNADTRPAGENCVSLVGQEVIYDGVNVILKREQLGRFDVCLVFWDNTDNDYVFIPVETHNASKLDANRYIIQNYVRFTRTLGRDVVMHKEQTSGTWAEFNRYKLECNTAAAGGFTWAVTINGAAKGGTVTWSAGATLDSIVSQMNTQGAVTNYLVMTHETGESFIRIRKGGYTNSTFTITDATGATLTDLSEFTKIAGVQQERLHRDWQAQDIAALFPGNGFLAANSAQYVRNGYNLSYMCGGNLSCYKTYYSANGSSTYVAESSIAARMTATAFAALNNSGVTEQQALYDKYGGNWDAYMDASMVKIDDEHTNGIEYQSYTDGDTQSQFLASVTTMDFDGSYISAYPAAYNAAQKTDTRGAITKWNMPTEHELAVFMSDEILAKINLAMTAIGGTALSITGSYWSVARYNSSRAWFYNGNDGRLSYNILFLTYFVRPLAYLN